MIRQPFCDQRADRNVITNRQKQQTHKDNKQTKQLTKKRKRKEKNKAANLQNKKYAKATNPQNDQSHLLTKIQHPSRVRMPGIMKILTQICV